MQASMPTQGTAMPKLTHDNLMTLEAYAKARPTLRAQVIAHKKSAPFAWAITLPSSSKMS